jgi:uncharacterized protein
MYSIIRNLQETLNDAISRGKSILLLGPRQTGKTTLIGQLTPELSVSLIQPRTRLRYERDPSTLADEIEALATTGKIPLVVIDEVQKVPLIMDVAQDLIDRKIAQFILAGSSARKLKRGSNINLLPGRVIPLHMDPLTITEIPTKKCTLEDLLLNGSLPQVITSESNAEKEELLESYVSLYLEEEIRAEAVVRNLASFSHFLELAAAESGFTVNYSKLSQTVGVAHTTIANYYQILEDCLVVHRIEPFTRSKTRHLLSKTPKYYLFDLGVRRIAAGEGKQLPKKYIGHLFEQFIVLELIRQTRLHKKYKIYYWRDPSGPKVDCVIQNNGTLVPIEIKYTDRPNPSDAKHLRTFINEYDEAEQGFIVCRAPRKMKIADNVIAIPWQEVHTIL